jgi:hypothetical protein
MAASSGFLTEERCCDNCKPTDCVYACRDCNGVRFSRACILVQHSYTPLHRIEVCHSMTSHYHILISFRSSGMGILPPLRSWILDLSSNSATVEVCVLCLSLILVISQCMTSTVYIKSGSHIAAAHHISPTTTSSRKSFANAGFLLHGNGPGQCLRLPSSSSSTYLTCKASATCTTSIEQSFV